MDAFRPYVELPGEPGSVEWLRRRAGLDVTGADAATAVGCGEHASPEQLAEQKRADRRATDAELLARSAEFDNVHTRAGRANEEPIAQRAAWLLLGGAPLTALRLCVSADVSERWYGATPDRVAFDQEGRVRAAIECKFSFFAGLPSHPKTEHVFQLHMQMRVLRLRWCYIAYGTRRTGLPRPSYDEPLLGGLALRVFKVEFSPELWDWMLRRLRAYRKLLSDPDAPEPPRMHHWTSHLWFERSECVRYEDCCTSCRSIDYLLHPLEARSEPERYFPPAPRWRLVRDYEPDEASEGPEQ